MMNRKRITISIAIVCLALLIAGISYANQPEWCQERAFQQSPAFGMAPRRFFTIDEVKSQNTVASQTYIIGMNCLAYTIVAVSKLSCGIQVAKDPTPEESASFETDCRKRWNEESRKPE